MALFPQISQSLKQDCSLGPYRAGLRAAQPNSVLLLPGQNTKRSFSPCLPFSHIEPEAAVQTEREKKGGREEGDGEGRSWERRVLGRAGVGRGEEGRGEEGSTGLDKT